VLARLRSEWLLWVVALAGVALLAWLGLQDFAFSDYDTEASAAYRSLIAGDIRGFLSQVPAYGGSLVLRAPCAGLTAALGGGELAVYRAVSIPGLLALAVLGLVLARRMAERGSSRGAQVLVVALCACNPIALRALQIGHPEELLCATFAILAVLAAGRDRPLLAGLLLGLAIATKAWAVLAIGPVLLALPARRMLALGAAGAVTALVLLPIVLVGSAAEIAHGARQTGIIFNPWQIWWPLGDVVNIGYDGLARPGGRFSPAWLSQLTHPLIAALVVPLSLAWRRRRRHATCGGEQLLALLALLLLLRCILDPWNTVYYQLPFLLALLSWEVLCRAWQPPVLTLGATIATWVSFETLKAQDPNLLFAVFVAWALPLAGWLAYTCLQAPLRTALPGKATQPNGSPVAPLQATGASDIALRRGR
jgi:hypothetical protein